MTERLKPPTATEAMREWMRAHSYREIRSHQLECNAFTDGFSAGIEAVLVGVEAQMREWRRRGNREVEIVAAGIAASMSLKWIGPHTEPVSEIPADVVGPTWVMVPVPYGKSMKSFTAKSARVGADS